MIVIRKSIDNKNHLSKDEANIGLYKFSYNELIGQGNQSKVYRGRHVHQKHQVAVKVINPSEIQDNLSKKLLKSSLVSLQTLRDSPHILNLHEIFYTQKMIYVVTQMCSSNLTQVIKEKITEEKAFKYLGQIIKGFRYLYDAGIVHRDIKPDNLFVNYQDQIKIGDFGFSARLYEVKKQIYFTIGSAFYMAPEIMLRNQYSHESDIWAIGISFFEMLTGELPWSSQGKIRQEMNQKYLNKRLNDAEISPKARKFLLKALAINKNDRFTAEQFINYFTNESQGHSEKETEDMSTNWSNSNAQIKINIIRSSKAKKDKSFDTNGSEPKKYQFNNKTNHLAIPMNSKDNLHITLSHEKDKPKGPLHHLLSPQKFPKKQIPMKVQMNHTSATNRCRSLFKSLKPFHNRNLDKIVLYHYDLARKINEFLTQIKYSSHTMKKYSEQIILMKICLKNILIKTCDKIMKISQSNLLTPYSSSAQISAYRASEQYQKSQSICQSLIKNLKQNKQIQLYWPKAKQQNLEGAINATVCFLKKIRTNMQNNLPNKQLLHIADLCVVLLNKMVLLLTQTKFEEKDQFFRNQIIEEEGSNPKNKILNEIQRVLKSVSELK